MTTSGWVKAIVFDWGRTLYDNEQEELFPEARAVLDALSKKFRLAIVSLATDGDMARRWDVLRRTQIEAHFESILFATGDKDGLYVTTLSRMGLAPEEVAIVDDRVIRGIRWGNQHGATTIWFRRGKFRDELPSSETGAPDLIIGNLTELLQFL